MVMVVSRSGAPNGQSTSSSSSSTNATPTSPTSIPITDHRAQQRSRRDNSHSLLEGGVQRPGEAAGERNAESSNELPVGEHWQPQQQQQDQAVPNALSSSSIIPIATYSATATHRHRGALDSEFPRTTPNSTAAEQQASSSSSSNSVSATTSSSEMGWYTASPVFQQSAHSATHHGLEQYCVGAKQQQHQQIGSFSHQQKKDWEQENSAGGPHHSGYPPRQQQQLVANYGESTGENPFEGYGQPIPSASHPRPHIGSNLSMLAAASSEYHQRVHYPHHEPHHLPDLKNQQHFPFGGGSTAGYESSTAITTTATVELAAAAAAAAWATHGGMMMESSSSSIGGSSGWFPPTMPAVVNNHYHWGTWGSGSPFGASAAMAAPPQYPASSAAAAAALSVRSSSGGGGGDNSQLLFPYFSQQHQQQNSSRSAPISSQPQHQQHPYPYLLPTSSSLATTSFAPFLSSSSSHPTQHHLLQLPMPPTSNITSSSPTTTKSPILRQQSPAAEGTHGTHGSHGYSASTIRSHLHLLPNEIITSTTPSQEEGEAFSTQNNNKLSIQKVRGDDDKIAKASPLGAHEGGVVVAPGNSNKEGNGGGGIERKKSRPTTTTSGSAKQSNSGHAKKHHQHGEHRAGSSYHSAYSKRATAASPYHRHSSSSKTSSSHSSQGGNPFSIGGPPSAIPNLYHLDPYSTALLSLGVGSSGGENGVNGHHAQQHQHPYSFFPLQSPAISTTSPSATALFSTYALMGGASGGEMPASAGGVPMSQERIELYLANPQKYQHTVTIYNAKVAQKSYGNEKRFFCPPPCIYLSGDGWRESRSLLERLHREYSASSSTGLLGTDQPSSITTTSATRSSNKEGNRETVTTRSSPRIGSGGDESTAATFLRSGAGISSSSKQPYDLCAFIGIGGDSRHQLEGGHQPCVGGGSADRQQLDFSSGRDYAAAKTLFISDSDKRKYFHLQASFYYAAGAIELGPFTSQRIKVISKPPKKKQSMKTTDCKYLAITDGTCVALFNRLRSQTVSTRYLHVEGGNFHASSTKWGAFIIHLTELAEPLPSSSAAHAYNLGCGGGLLQYPNPLLPLHGGQHQQQHIPQHYPAVAAANPGQSHQTTGPPGGSVVNLPGAITYGSIVQLIDSVSHVALPRLRVRRMEKQSVLVGPQCQGEPVSQLHKCAFQMVDTPDGTDLYYLCLSHDKIIQHQAVRLDANRHQVSDGAAWTIISTERAEYTFALAPEVESGCADGCAVGLPRQPVTPIPTLHTLNMARGGGGNDGVGGGIETASSMMSMMMNYGRSEDGSPTIPFELHGTNFSPALRVWFGALQLETEVLSETLMKCWIPWQQLPSVNGGSGGNGATCNGVAGGRTELPILLVRQHDGVIYPTGLTFNYPLMM